MSCATLVKCNFREFRVCQPGHFARSARQGSAGGRGPFNPFGSTAHRHFVSVVGAPFTEAREDAAQNPYGVVGGAERRVVAISERSAIGRPDKLPVHRRLREKAPPPGTALPTDIRGNLDAESGAEALTIPPLCNVECVQRGKVPAGRKETKRAALSCPTPGPHQDLGLRRSNPSSRWRQARRSAHSNPTICTNRPEDFSFCWPSVTIVTTCLPGGRLVASTRR